MAAPPRPRRSASTEVAAEVVEEGFAAAVVLVML
jgi:hypothetical protein